MFRKSTDKRVAAFFADGLEECEGLVVCDLLFRSGIPCDKVSITSNRSVKSSHQVTIACDRSIDDADFSFEDYDVLFLPGGMPGTKNLRACERLCDAVVAHARAGRDVAAICAAPSILAELGLLEGRRATSNPGFQDVLAEHGATVLQDPVVEDGNLVTSKGLGTAIELGIALTRRLLGDEAVETLKGKIVYNG
jgi:4-methyl-5(b-hydroxyethyl)-thiazole monophosphate biosynthesis